ncbi:MAG: hypothetical protein EAZ57_07730 [Cytophagales bacterium]|nr:MAG: hypothetical protein EAZ67_08815 [Cytophagales bacterium]TAF60427.1 MAG: hypothetical protein EAZ57_07730 [Cytophagales bacterium]
MKERFIKISRKTKKRIWNRNGAYDVDGLYDCGMNGIPVSEKYPPRGNYEDIKQFDRLAR